MSLPALALEAAAEVDIPALVDLEQRCQSHPWTARNFREELGDPARGRLVVLRTPFDPGDPRRGIVAYSAYQVVAREMHLLNLAVAPEHRRTGLGATLLARILEQGDHRGAESVFLEVRKSNLAAQALYERFGFRILAVRRDYYEDPREDALVLARGGPTPSASVPATAP